MTELLASISFDHLVERLVGSEYAFASWRLPLEEKPRTIVGLNEVEQTDSSLADLSTGFLINSFEENHPPRPFHIKADLIFSDGEAKIDSKVNAELVDVFLSYMNRDTQRRKLADSIPAKSEKDPFEALVKKAIQEINSGRFEKVVLSRFEDVQLPEDFSISDFFDQVCEAYPNAFCSLVHLPGMGLWIGASPELLISQDSVEFRTISLAGTKKIDTELPLSEIAWAQKEIEEQALVSRYIINRFKEIRLREFVEHGPKTIKAGNLAHLKTEYVVKLSEVQIDDLGDQMLNLLHPTSAVCGMPLKAASKFVLQNENYDREFYSGFLGPVNFDSRTDLFVNLRCMKVEAGNARLFAGAGITEDSVPANEFMETELKLEILSRLVNFKEN